MTTTLRPVAPEQSAPDGARSRAYAICVNGRPVGTVRLAATGASASPRVGQVQELTVDQAERGRGRGTVAALAAEEVLRGWDCTRVDLALAETADTPAALRFATALGYTVRARNMVKTLPVEPPALPGGVTARPISDEDYPAWAARGNAGHLAMMTSAGMSEQDARAKAAADFAMQLPQGPDTPGTVLRWMESAGERVGWLWLALSGPDLRDGERPAWVFDVEVLAEHRGRGHGRSLMLLAERECLAAGVRQLGLNVFADNTAANALHRSLGYEVYRTTLHKYL